MNALKIAATGMMAQQTNVDLLSNNISNLSTTAFKRQRASFNDLVYQTKVAPGAVTSDTGTLSPTGAQIGLGVDVRATYKIFEQGAMSRTDAPFDIGIQGRGLFQITMPDGTINYTRDGSFEVDNNGQLVTKQGYAVDPAITIPADATNLTITETGIVSADVNNQIVELGQITVAMFINETGLSNQGGNLYKETPASGTAIITNPSEDGSGKLLQFHIETSNVDPIESVTDLIAAQRAYELNSRVISTADEMLSAVNQMR